MKYLFLTFSFLLAVTLSGQHSSVKVSEREGEDHYTFSLRSTDLTEEIMNDVFTAVSEGKVEGRFTGLIRTTLEDGVEVKMNTQRRMFEVSYAGEDQAALAHAKTLAASLQERLKSEHPR